MDRINELLARLAELSADELAELNGLIQAEADALADEPATAENVAALGTLADAREQSAAEETRREQEQTALDEQREAALARLRPVADGEGDAETGDEPADGEDQAETDQAERQPEAVAASARTRRPGMGQLAGRRPAGRAPEARRGEEQTGARTRITSATSGRELTTRREIAAELSTAIESSRGVRAGFKRSVVSAVTEFPEPRRLHAGADQQNEALVAAALEGLSMQSLVAAGGLCAPIENLYDVRVVGTADRPVRDALAAFQADRGGVSLRPSPVFADWDGAVGAWTLQNDIDAGTAGGAEPTKPIIEALCPGFEDFFVEAIPARVRFRNVSARFDPEGTEANVTALDIVHARFAENRLLSAIAAQSLAVTAPKVLGAARDLLVTIDRSVAYYRNRHRLGDTAPMRVILGRWVRDMIRADITRGDISLDALAVADQMINEWFARRAVTPTWTLDGRPAAQAAVAGPPVVVGIAAQQYAAAISGSEIPEFPDTVEMLLFAEGDFLFLDGGTLDLGVVRDSGLNEVNAYELFKETFEGVAFRGVESLQVVATVDPNGLVAGSKDTTAISD